MEQRHLALRIAAKELLHRRFHAENFRSVLLDGHLSVDRTRVGRDKQRDLCLYVRVQTQMYVYQGC